MTSTMPFRLRHLYVLYAERLTPSAESQTMSAAMTGSYCFNQRFARMTAMASPVDTSFCIYQSSDLARRSDLDDCQFHHSFQGSPGLLQVSSRLHRVFNRLIQSLHVPYVGIQAVHI